MKKLSPALVSLFNNAVNLQKQSRFSEAAELYKMIYAQAPDHFETNYCLGIVCHRLGDIDSAVLHLSKAIQLDKKNASAYFNLGNCFFDKSDFHSAITNYSNAIKYKANYPEAYNGKGNALREIGRYSESIDALVTASKLKPGNITPIYNLSLTYADCGELDKAIPLLESILATHPTHINSLVNLATLYTKIYRNDEAIGLYNKALEIMPENALALYGIGKSLADAGRHNEAIIYLEKLINIDPSHINAITLCATAFCKANNTKKAIPLLNWACHNNPTAVELYIAAGYIYSQYYFMYSEAIDHFNTALTLDENNLNALSGLVDALIFDKASTDGIVALEKLLRLDPDHERGLGRLHNARLAICDWTDYQNTKNRLEVLIKSGINADAPFSCLGAFDDPDIHLHCAMTTAKNVFTDQPLLWSGEIYQHPRIRIGYISSDLHEHPTAYLMAELFELHNRDDFEIIALSLGRDIMDPMRARLLQAFDQFHSVRDYSDLQIASLIRSLEIDILVDLKGYTFDSRPLIFSYKPAPITVNYIGYPGTMGSSLFDYIIADQHIITEENADFMTEHIVYMPDTYQPNDRQRPIASSSTRKLLGIPEDALVFCCFNNNYKITPDIFSIWMSLLEQIDNSVLWLFGDNAAAMANLKLNAERAGIEPDRLIFAERVNLPEHLARYPLADIFLDTLPYNAHTTASDALWAGLPVVTCAGRAFAGRVASSLLQAVGLPELITHTLDEYKNLALRLASNPDELKAIKSKLLSIKNKSALFDTPRYTQHLETSYKIMWSRYQHKEPHADIRL